MELSLLSYKKSLSQADFALFLQKQGQIFFCPSEKAWVITSYDIAKQAYTDENLSANRIPYFEKIMADIAEKDIDCFFNVIKKFMVMSDSPAHTSRRRICYHAITHTLLEKLKNCVQFAIKTQIESLKSKSEIDLVKDFFELILVELFSELFSVPKEKRFSFFKAASTMTQFFGGLETYTYKDAQAVNEAAKTLSNYFNELLAARRINDTDDLVSTLLKFQHDYDLNDSELIAQCIIILVAGQVTTIDQASNIFYQYYLLDNEMKVNLAKQNPDIVIEELSRLDPAVCFNVRIAKTSMQLANTDIKQGDVILISNIAANYDPAVFNNPRNLDFTRTETKQLSYGFGTHFCLGTKIARMVLGEILCALQSEFSDWKLAKNAAPERKNHSLAFSGYNSIFITSSPT
jgi:cytochrome P450